MNNKLTPQCVALLGLAFIVGWGIGVISYWQIMGSVLLK